MSNDIIQAEYDKLESIASRFAKNAESTAHKVAYTSITMLIAKTSNLREMSCRNGNMPSRNGNMPRRNGNVSCRNGNMPRRNDNVSRRNE